MALAPSTISFDQFLRAVETDPAIAFHHGIKLDPQRLSGVFSQWLDQLQRGVSPLRLDVEGLHYRVVNKLVREATGYNVPAFVLENVNGQRYLGDGLEAPVKIDIYGVPGNDLAAFMNGPIIVVHNNAQDGIGNTMNEGKVVIQGDAGDVIGYGMRGGKIHIRGNVGYRVGIHMKEYQSKIPVIIAGGIARDFYGEYQAGGVLVLLGLGREPGEPLVGDYVGTGQHGGVIYLRGEVPGEHLGKEVGIRPFTPEDEAKLRSYLAEFCADFDLDLEEVMAEPFTKLIPVSHRPYGKLYSN